MTTKIDTRHKATARLSNHVKRAIAGPMWHGPALDELLSSVPSDHAAAHPVPGAHSIWELVLHLTAWAEIVRARLHGDRMGDPATEEDWPRVGPTAPSDWVAALEKLRQAHSSLAEDVRRLPEDMLDEKIPSLEYTASNMLHGVIEHSTYHGGQIAVLKRALAGSAR